MRRSSADSGFGLLPDRARTSTRYACPGRKRRESRKQVLIVLFKRRLRKLNNAVVDFQRV